MTPAQRMMLPFLPANDLARCVGTFAAQGANSAETLAALEDDDRAELTTHLKIGDRALFRSAMQPLRVARADCAAAAARQARAEAEELRAQVAALTAEAQAARPDGFFFFGGGGGGGGDSPGCLTVRPTPMRGFRAESLPGGIEHAVVGAVVAGTRARQTNEGDAHGAVFVLVPPGTALGAVGYHLEDSGMTRGFVSDRVRFSDANTDAKLKFLLALDGATVVDGTSGEIVAICFAIEVG